MTAGRATAPEIKDLTEALRPLLLPTFRAVLFGSRAPGEYLGTLQADHYDEVGQVVGLTEQFDHLAFFRGLAQDLKARGF
jgi:hypothetical protein